MHLETDLLAKLMIYLAGLVIWELRGESLEGLLAFDRIREKGEQYWTQLIDERREA